MTRITYMNTAKKDEDLIAEHFGREPGLGVSHGFATVDAGKLAKLIRNYSDLHLAVTLAIAILWFIAIIGAVDAIIYVAHAADDPTPAQFEAATRVAWGEMRSGSKAEIAGVCAVMMRRVDLGLWGDNVRDVAHARKQFSAYNKTDVNRVKLLRPGLTSTRSYARVARICRRVMQGTISDATGIGADHYYNGRRPYWAKHARARITIGRTHFVRLFPKRRDAIGELIASLED